MKSSFRLVIPVLAFMLHACANGQETGLLDLEKMDAYIEEARKAWQVPGMAVAIVKGDSVVFARGYGVREHGRPENVDENTVFCIASITKSFTSTAMAMLDDEEKINWDDPVREHLPDFKMYDPWVSEEMRIRDLLCHRSGLKTFSGDLLWFETDYTRREVLDRMHLLKPAYGFRYEYGYSNLAFLAAGEIFPRACGVTWDNFVRERILLPLGMDRTSLDLDGLRSDPNIASPHHVKLLDSTTYVLPYISWENIAPAGALNSSVMDLTRWVRFQLRFGDWNGEQLVSAENLWETRKLHVSQPPELGSNRIWPSRHFAGYGLGWEMYDYHGCKVFGHEGGTDGMLTRLVYVPEEDFGFIMLTNSISAITIGLEYYILDQYHKGESYDWCSLYLESATGYLESERMGWEAYLAGADRSVAPSLDLGDYAGGYVCDLYGGVSVETEGDGLVLDFLPSDRLLGDLEVFSGDTFLLELRNMPFFPQGTVVFELDGAGGVEGLEIDIPNPDFDFTELDLKRID